MLKNFFGIVYAPSGLIWVKTWGNTLIAALIMLKKFYVIAICVDVNKLFALVYAPSGTTTSVETWGNTQIAALIMLKIFFMKLVFCYTWLLCKLRP